MTGSTFRICGGRASYSRGEAPEGRPGAGSFADYAEEFLGPLAGFATGWSYGIIWVVTGAEISAAGIYVKYLFPDIPQWVTAAVVLLAC